MTSGEASWGEQTLSKVAEMGITSRLDEVDQINVDIRTDPLKLMQGKVDSVTIEGEGMVMQQDLRMEELTVSTNSVAIDPMSALGGKLELSEPAEASARVVLTGEDINRALKSDLLRQRMQGLAVEVQGETVHFDVHEAFVQLMDDGKMRVTASVQRQHTGELGQLSATAIPKVADGGYRIGLEVVSIEDENSSPGLTMAVLKKIMELSDLRNFDLEGMSLKLRSLTVRENRLTLYSDTQIEQIPTL